MANYYGVGRTSYVKVKDSAAFREAAEKFARVYEEDGAFVLLDDNPMAVSGASVGTTRKMTTTATSTRLSTSLPFARG